MKPSGGLAVMAERLDPLDSLDFFPTPPWATRALCEHVLCPINLKDWSCWEPAAGEGHMAEVLREYFRDVFASDVHDYGRGYRVGSFVGAGPDVMPPLPCDYIITNPPFNLAIVFAERALEVAGRGVALLTRTAWLEGAERWERLFSRTPPSVIALFAERVPMVKGRWDPKASTATSYAWIVWLKWDVDTRLQWIPPGRRQALTRANDAQRFARAA